MEQIREGRSVMVAAPTSSGKTVVAEYALWRALQNGTRAIYTTPIKALSNQKRRDLEQMFPGQVGLLTGDRSENPDAAIVVMTTEVLRNMLVEDPDALSWVTHVVFDEVHYLADPDRGTVWEEAIITCPRHVQLVCLSATMANAAEIADWIGETHRDIALIRHDERPVPLEHLYYTQGKLHLVRDEYGRRRAMFPREGHLQAPDPAAVVRALRRENLLPAIWFAFSRRAVEEAAAEIGRSAPRLPREQQAAIEEAIAWTLDLLPLEDRSLPQLSLLLRLLRRGIGFHHAGLLPPMKELVERLFSSGLLSVVCATDTLAVGINMPARTVVISSLQRPFGGTLTPNDFSQLTGRAGRRGIDEQGAVVMLPSRHYVFENDYRQVCAPLEPIMSSFRLRYSTLLSAMAGNEQRLGMVVRSSLRQFQMRAKARRAQQQLEAIREEILPTANEEAVRDYLLLQTRLSLAEKEQRRARRAKGKAAESTRVRKRLERAREHREHLATLLRDHPAHFAVTALETQDPERLYQLRQINRLQTIIDEAQQECDQEALETADAVREVLTRLGYVGKDGLTPKAHGLREIVAPSGIVLSEMYDRGELDDLTPAELAEVISWFACDQERRRENDFRLPRTLIERRHAADRVFRIVATAEEEAGIDLAQGPSRWFFGVAYAWCRGASISEITRRVELGEGDIVSILNKTVDLLDQLTGMLEQHGDRRLLAIAAEAHRQLVRGLVAMVRTPEEAAA